jgi:hypothetical protein
MRGVRGAPGANVLNVYVSPTTPFALAVDGGSNPAAVLNVIETTGTAVVRNGPAGFGAGTAQALFSGGTASAVSYVNIGGVTLSPDAGHSFIQQLYHQILHRTGSPGEINFWFGMLQATGDGAAVARGIINSAEARTGLVVGWFQYYYGRNPLPGEVQPWVTLLVQGSPEEQVLASFLGAPEYYARAGLRDDVFIQLLYQQIIGRPASAWELGFWEQALGTPAGRGGVAFLLLNSAEHRAAVVQADYNAVLRRNARATEVQFWALSGLDFTGIVAAMAASPEFINSTT